MTVSAHSHSHSEEMKKQTHTRQVYMRCIQKGDLRSMRLGQCCFRLGIVLCSLQVSEQQPVGQ